MVVLRFATEQHIGFYQTSTLELIGKRSWADHERLIRADGG